MLLISFYYRLRVRSVQIWLCGIVKRLLLVACEVCERSSPYSKVIFVNIGPLLLERGLLVVLELVSILVLEGRPHRFEFRFLCECLIDFLIEIYPFVAHFNISIFKIMRFIPEFVVNL
jgi:hypothetical protein